MSAIVCSTLSSQAGSDELNAQNSTADHASAKLSPQLSFVIAWKGPDDGTWIHTFDDHHRAINPRPWSNSFQVQEDRGDPKIAVRHDGTSAAVWQKRDRNFRYSDIKARIYGADGNPKGSEITVITADTLNEISEFAIAALSNGYLLLWTKGELILSRKLNSELQPISDNAHFNLKPGTNPKHLAIASFSDGGFILAWRTGDTNTCSRERNNTVFILTFNASNEPIGQPTVIADYTNCGCHPAARRTGPEIAVLAQDKAVVTWRDGDGTLAETEEIMAHIVDRRARTVKKTFRVNELTRYRLEQDSSIAALRDGGFVVTWTSLGIGRNGIGPELNTRSVIRGLRFDKNGNKVGREFVVNRSLRADQSAVAGLADGGFAVAWYGCVVDGNDCELNFHAYGRDGESKTEGNVYPITRGGQPAINALPFLN